MKSCFLRNVTKWSEFMFKTRTNICQWETKLVFTLNEVHWQRFVLLKYMYPDLRIVRYLRRKTSTFAVWRFSNIYFHISRELFIFFCEMNKVTVFTFWSVANTRHLHLDTILTYFWNVLYLVLNLLSESLQKHCFRHICNSMYQTYSHSLIFLRPAYIIHDILT